MCRNVRLANRVDRRQTFHYKISEELPVNRSKSPDLGSGCGCSVSQTRRNFRERLAPFFELVGLSTIE